MRMRPYLPYLSFILALLLISSQILIRPVAGLADNGDFANSIGPFRLIPSEAETAQRYFTHIVQNWRYDPAAQPVLRLWTSQFVLIAPLVWLARAFTAGSLDIRAIGAIHAAMFLAALWLLAPAIGCLRRPWKMVAVSLLVVLLFCDAAYVTHFNTFYMDAAAFGFFCLLVALYVRLRSRHSPTRSDAMLVAVAAYLFATAKLQHTLLVPLLAGFWLLDRAVRRALPVPAWRYSVVAILVTGAAIVYWDVPRDYRASAAYNIVFHELMPVEQDRVMREFKLPFYYQTLSGTNAFSSQSGLRSDYLRNDLIRRVNHRTLLTYYFRHPDVMVRLIRMALIESAYQRPVGFGNFALSAGKPARATAQRFAFWTDALRAAFSGRPWFYALYALAVMVFAGDAARRRFPAAFLPTLLLILCALVEFFVSAIGDAAETTRHLFFFRFLLDLLLVLGVYCWLIEKQPATRPAH